MPPESDRTTEAIGRVRKRSGNIFWRRGVHGSSKSFPSSYSPIRLIPEHGKPSRQKPGRVWVEISQVIRARPDAHGAFLEVLLRVLCVCGCVAFLLTCSSLSGRYCINSAVSRNNLDFSSSSTEQRKSVRGGAVCPAAIQFRRVISSLESSIVFAAFLSAMTLRYTQPNLSIPFQLSSLSLSLSLANGNLHAYNASGSQSLPQNWKVIHLFAIAILIYIVCNMHALFILLVVNLFGLAIIQSNFFHFFFLIVML